MRSILSIALSAAMVVAASPMPQLTAPDGYWAADIYQNGCLITNPEDNPRYSLVQKGSLDCTSIRGDGYQSVAFADPTGNWALNVFTDSDCQVPLTEDFTTDGCVTTPEGQYVVAISVTQR